MSTVFVSQLVGPITVPLVSSNSSPPIPLPMQVPPGHVVQQIVDENGTLRHVIVTHQPPLLPIPTYVSEIVFLNRPYIVVYSIFIELSQRVIIMSVKDCHVHNKFNWI